MFDRQKINIATIILSLFSTIISIVLKNPFGFLFFGICLFSFITMVNIELKLLNNIMDDYRNNVFEIKEILRRVFNKIKILNSIKSQISIDDINFINNKTRNLKLIYDREILNFSTNVNIFKKYNIMYNKIKTLKKLKCNLMTLEQMINNILKNYQYNSNTNNKKYNHNKNYNKYQESLNTLNLKNGCTMEEIKKSYKKLAKQYHPDSINGNQEKFVKLVNAYEYLCNIK